jgi:hypothetical protein
MQKSEIEPSRKLLQKIEPLLAPVRPSRGAERGPFVSSMNVGDHDIINSTAKNPAMTMYTNNSQIKVYEDGLMPISDTLRTPQSFFVRSPENLTNEAPTRI